MLEQRQWIMLGMGVSLEGVHLVPCVLSGAGVGAWKSVPGTHPPLPLTTPDSICVSGWHAVPSLWGGFLELLLVGIVV